MTDLRPPIPVWLADNPTSGGLAVPWINVNLADGGYDFRAPHNAKVEQCWTERRCQICGEPINGVLVLFGGPNQIREMTFDEPPMHPQCATYAAKACPMVAGRRSHYATHDRVSDGPRGKACPVDGCDCGGWVPTPGLASTAGGDPAHAWYSVWANDYAIVVTSAGRIHGGRLLVAPRKVRHLSDPPVAAEVAS